MEIMHVLKRLFLFTFSLALCFFANNIQAQQPADTTLLYRVQTIDGNEYIGSMLEQNEEYILLRTNTIGEITIARENIKSILLIEADQVKGNEVWLENPQATRYFWQPNGFGLKRGEGYYQNVWILFNQASVGITDHISIGAGVVPLFLFAGTSTPAWITPKFSIPVVEDKFSLGAGALVGSVLGETDAGFGIVYGIGTLGNRDRNASLGVGYGYAAGTLASNPTITFSGMYRTGKNGYLLTENYIISLEGETLVLLSFGGRRIIRNVGLDFGLFSPFYPDIESIVALPWLGLTVPFGNKIEQPRR